MLFGRPARHEHHGSLFGGRSRLTPGKIEKIAHYRILPDSCTGFSAAFFCRFFQSGLPSSKTCSRYTPAGKTGSLSGKDPSGRYEWFAGVAPADEPRIAVAVLVVQGKLWWRNASQIASEVLKRVFCVRGRCDVAHVTRYVSPVAHGETEAQAPLIGAAALGIAERP